MRLRLYGDPQQSFFQNQEHAELGRGRANGQRKPLYMGRPMSVIVGSLGKRRAVRALSTLGLCEVSDK